MIFYNKTWVSIANESLARLGTSQIDSLETSGSTETFCNQLLPATISMVFGTHDWNCARKRVSLSMSANIPAFGYAYQFTLPNDFSKAQDVSSLDYSIEGNQLLCNDEFVNMIYIALPEDASFIIPPMLRSAIVLCLAYMLCEPLTGSSTLTTQLYNEFSVALSNAKIQNDAENEQDVLGETLLWVDQR